MNRPMALLWVLAVAAAATPCVAADSGGRVRGGGGTPSGDYISFSRATCDALGSLFSCRPVATQGSQDNVARLKLPLTDPQALAPVGIGDMDQTVQLIVLIADGAGAGHSRKQQGAAS